MRIVYSHLMLKQHKKLLQPKPLMGLNSAMVLLLVFSLAAFCASVLAAQKISQFGWVFSF